MPFSQNSILKDVIEKRALNSSPEELISPFSKEKWLSIISKESGISIQELKDMIESGTIDNYLSEGFFALSLVALSSSIEEIQSGNMPVEKLPDIALKAADLGRKMAGRDIKKVQVIDSSMWQKAAEEAIEVKGETLDD